MTLDVRTIVVLMIMASLLMTATLAFGGYGRRAGGMEKWSIGLGLFALGWILVAAREILPAAIGLAAADAILLTGLCCQLAAVIEFGGADAPRWLLYAPGPLLFAAVLPIMHNYPLFTLAVSLAYAGAFVGIGALALRAGARAGGARWMLAASYAAAAVALTVRALMIMVDPAANPELFSASPVHAVTFVALFSVTITGSMAFLLMLRQHDEAEIRRLAMFDPLTELFNRRAFVDLAERELARARRSGAPCAVLMLDLDHFKRVNDKFGHQAGDRVLVDFATIARQSVRAEDVVGRYGGEEFCAILPGAALPQAMEIAERIRAAAAEHPQGGLPCPTTVSIGLTICAPGVEASLDDAVARADEALYRAKEQGRNRVVGLALAPSVQPEHPADFAQELARADAVRAQLIGRPVEQSVH